jgi:hypothetical protein
LARQIISNKGQAVNRIRCVGHVQKYLSRFRAGTGSASARLAEQGGELQGATITVH